jgi:hypothetical protein
MKKPKYLKCCRHRYDCYNGIAKDCIGCNIWNFFYNYKEMEKWCKEHKKSAKKMSMCIMVETKEYKSEIMA